MARPRQSGIDEAVLDACRTLLGEVGRARLTRQQIARRAGVSLPAMTRRFAAVEDVVLAVAASPPARAALPRTGVATVRDRLVAVARRSLAELQSPGQRRAEVEVLAAAAGEPRVARALAATTGRAAAETLVWVRAAPAEDDSSDDLGLALDLLEGAVRQRLLWRSSTLDQYDVEQLVDLVLTGVRGGPRTASG